MMDIVRKMVNNALEPLLSFLTGLRARTDRFGRFWQHMGLRLSVYQVLHDRIMNLNLPCINNLKFFLMVSEMVYYI